MSAAGKIPPNKTKAVPIAVALTAAACGLCMLGYMMVVRDRGAADCSCVGAGAEGSSDRTIPNARAESMIAALATIAAARSGPETPAAPTGPGPASVPPPAAEPPEPPAVVSKEEVLARQKADAHTLDTQLGSEEVDPVWAPKVERATTEAFARLGGSMRLDEVTCRDTLCRARVTHLDPRVHDQDVERLFDMPVLAGQALALSPADDPRNTVLYFSRKGAMLSVLQPQMRMFPPADMSPDELTAAGLGSPGAATPSTGLN
jgi:hypothetical protein